MATPALSRDPSPAQEKPGSLKAALALAIATPFLTELLSGNQSPARFFFPPTFLFLLVVYGIPVLLIRDFWIRIGAGVPALFLLGLAYGVYNEGIVAKTLLRSSSVPLGVFDGYTIGGINWAWAALIVPWHALLAVTGPIILITWLVPRASSQRWLSHGFYLGGVIIAVLAGSTAFFVFPTPRASPIYLLIFFAFIAAAFALSGRLPRVPAFQEESGAWIWRHIAWGLLFYPLFVISLCLLAAMHAPIALILSASGLWLYLLYGILSRGGLTLNRLVLFCLSDYLSAAAITGLILARHGNLPGCAVHLILIAPFVIGLRRTYLSKVRP